MKYYSNRKLYMRKYLNKYAETAFSDVKNGL